MGDIVEATVVNAKAKSSIGFLYKEAGRTQGRVGWANSTESESIRKVLLEGIGFGGGQRVYLSRQRQKFQIVKLDTKIVFSMRGKTIV
jgi:hypothetical protein